MDETADTAIDVALGATTRMIDLIKVTVDDQGPGAFRSAGRHHHAMNMEETDLRLKDKFGSPPTSLQPVRHQTASGAPDCSARRPPACETPRHALRRG